MSFHIAGDKRDTRYSKLKTSFSFTIRECHYRLLPSHISVCHCATALRGEESISFQWASPWPVEYMYGPTTARPISFFDPPSLGTVYTDNMKLTRSRHVGRMVKTKASLNTGNAVFLLITVFRFFKVFPPIIIDTLTYGSEIMHLLLHQFFDTWVGGENGK